MPLAALTWGNLLFSWYQLLLLLTGIQNHKPAARWAFGQVHAEPRAGRPQRQRQPALLPRERVGRSVRRGAERGSFHMIIPCNIVFFEKYLQRRAALAPEG